MEQATDPGSDSRTAARQLEAERLALRERLLGIVAEAPSFTHAIEAAMAALREATASQLCLFFRLGPDGERMHLVAGQADTPALTEAFLAHIGSMEVRRDNSLVGMVAASGEQQVVSAIGAETMSRFPAIRLSVSQRIATQVVTPLSLGEERYAFSVGFAAEPEGCAEIAATLAGLAATLRPLLRRMRGEEAIALNEQRFRLAARAVSDAVWDWDLATGALWWSEGMQTRFGYPPAAVEPTLQWWTERIADEDRHRVTEGLRDAVAGRREEWREEYRFRKACGTLALVSDRGFVLHGADGRAARMLGCMVDITRQRQLEEELRQSQRLDALGKLTGGVAHDFNNLLAVIMGNAEMLRETTRDAPAAREPVGMIIGAAERGADLARRLLAFARLQPLDPRPTDVNPLLGEVAAMVRRLIGADIEIKVAPTAAPALVVIDRPQLENAILNLCINARDAMPQGGRLCLSSLILPGGAGPRPAGAPQGDCVVIEVSDTGSGMTPEVLSRAFEPFFTTKPFGQGSGLGLSMVFGFVSQSRGHVAIDSQPGQGARVSLYLPRVAAAAETAAAAGATPAGAGAVILLVEDDAALRDVVAAQLGWLGYQVLTAADGRQALDLLRARADVALLFTDIVMPGGMSGQQLAERSRALRPDLPVLFTSGYPDSALPGDGAARLLAKPYRLADLARRINQALSEAPPRAG